MRPAPSPPPGLLARRLAAEIVGGVLRKRRPLDDLLATSSLGALPERDRALVRAIVATVLRRLGTLRHLISAALERGLPRDAPQIEAVLLTGAAQILFLDVPDHAAVDLSVRLIQADRHGSRYSGLVNGVLRRLARDGAKRLAALDTALLDTPEWLMRRWIRALRRGHGARHRHGSHGRRPRSTSRSKTIRNLGREAQRPRAGARLGAHHRVRSDLAARRLRGRRLVGAGRRRALPARLLGDVRGQDGRRPVRGARRQDRASSPTPARTSPRSIARRRGWPACAKIWRG